MLPKTEDNAIKLPQKILADELDCCVSSVGRYLKELVTAKFVQFLEAQKPGEIRSLQMVIKAKEPKRVEEPKKVEIPARSLTLPSPPGGEGKNLPKPLCTPPPPKPSNPAYVLPIYRPLEVEAVELDTMGEAVLETALKEPIPPGKDMPASIDKYCEDYLYKVQPKGFFRMAYLIRERYTLESKALGAK